MLASMRMGPGLGSGVPQPRPARTLLRIFMFELLLVGRVLLGREAAAAATTCADLGSDLHVRAPCLLVVSPRGRCPIWDLRGRWFGSSSVLVGRQAAAAAATRADLRMDLHVALLIGWLSVTDARSPGEARASRERHGKSARWAGGRRDDLRGSWFESSCSSSLFVVVRE